MRRVTTTKTLSLFILVMWIVSLYTCFLIITYSLSNPLINNQQDTFDSTDEFYKEMQFTLEKILNRSSQGAKRMNRRDFKRDGTIARPFPEIQTIPKLEMSPLNKCDKYEKESRTCSHVRQIGTTLTLGVQLEQSEKNARYRIRWFRCYKQRHKKDELKIEFTKKNSPWNINLGRGSTELRISPLTESDFSYNYFEATIDDIRSLDTEYSLRQKIKHEQKSGTMPIKFVIESINTDMGSLYPGEELTIYARTFIELPLRSVTLEWSMKDSDFKDLPSNMRVIGDGSSVVVNELEAQKDRVLICSVFSNKDIFVARRNFLFRKMAKVNTPQDLVHFTPKVNFKRRKKRYAAENPEFEDTDYETIDHLRPQATSLQEKLEKLNNPFGEYRNNKKRFIDQPDPDYTNKKQYQGDSLDQSSDSLAINNNLFYKNENELELNNNNANTGQSAQRDISKRLLHHGSRFPINMNHHLSRFHGDSKNGLSRAHHKYRDAIQKYPDRKFLNNKGDSANFLKRKLRYDRKRATEVGHSEWRNQYLSQKEDIRNAYREAEAPENSNPGKELEEMDNEGYTFDDMESMLIAECTEDQDCSNHATCLKNSVGKRFCKCVSHYKGNGIFCWFI